MRLWIGGVETTWPARWFWCAPGARLFPFPHGCESSVWLKNYEINEVWGEVTPYPQDPRQNAIRGLDRGLNPGYPGLCYVGQDQWFIDGMLPAGITDGPPPAFPVCCRPNAAVASGGLILGGTAFVTGRAGAVGSGGLILGGTAAPSGTPGYVGTGGLILGGTAQPASGYRAAGSGGLILGGTASSSKVPGAACMSAALLAMDAPSPSVPLSPAGSGWWSFRATAGQSYSIRVTASGSVTGLLNTVFSGTCSSLAAMETVNDVGCLNIDPPYTGVYYVYSNWANNPGVTFQVEIASGPCP